MPSIAIYIQAGADSGKSTVEDQLHEAEANKNASSFVKVASLKIICAATYC